MLDLWDQFAPFFPIEGSVAQLAVVKMSHPSGEEDDARLVVRLIVFDEQEGERAIRDIKEQELFMGKVWLYEDEQRVCELLHAMQEVMSEVLSKPLEVIDGLMPHDVLPRDLLTLKKARTREDFAAAMRKRSRLGKLLER